LCRPRDHSEQIARIVGVGQHIELREMRVGIQLVADVAQGREILGREAHTVEQRDLTGTRPPLRLARHHAPQLGDGVVFIKLLNFTLHPRLRRVFHEDVGAEQDVAMQLGFAGAVAADGVDMDTTADHVVGQDGGQLLVGGAGRDDLRACDGVFRCGAGGHGQTRVGEVGRAFFGQRSRRCAGRSGSSSRTTEPGSRCPRARALRRR